AHRQSHGESCDPDELFGGADPPPDPDRSGRSARDGGSYADGDRVSEWGAQCADRGDLPRDRAEGWGYRAAAEEPSAAEPAVVGPAADRTILPERGRLDGHAVPDVSL